MSDQTITDLAQNNGRHLLVAVDGSENSKRAVIFVAHFFLDVKDAFITILSIIPEPSEDYFATDSERSKWIAEKKAEMQDILAEYKEILRGAGYRDEQIDIRLVIRQCESIADAILEEQEKIRSAIVVVGRRGLTHNEEFMFGSTSNKILHQAKNCAVLVVE
ncbi:MAG: universal stress protein [Desulfobulbaceae bacterium]|nr:universal stress protein [Desulfobulbaceae bacterium]